MPAIPTAPTIVDGVSSSSQGNQFRDAINFLQNRPHFKLRQSSAQTYANNTNTAVQFNAETIDTDVSGNSGHDTVTNNTRWTAAYPGYYQVAGTVTWVANATGIRWAFLRVNGVDVDGSAGTSPGTAAEVLSVHTQTCLLYLANGDYVEVIGLQSSGGNLNTYVVGAWQPTVDGLWVSV